MTFSKSTQKELETFSTKTQEELKNLKRISEVMEGAGYSLVRSLRSISTRNMTPPSLRAHRRRIRLAELLVEWGEIPDPLDVKLTTTRPNEQ